MTTELPRIAIPEPTSTDPAYNQRSLPQYIRAVESAGGVAVPISLLAAATEQADLLGSCTGILLPGSPADLDPARYGQEPQKETAARDTAREALDDLLLHDAFGSGKPLLGICYGLQSLNVFKSGTLVQHLTGGVNHQPGRKVLDAHRVSVTAGSTLAGLLEESDLMVNSSHHQAVDRPGEFLKVAAISPADGVIEALEAQDPEWFLIAVQWHPERSYEHSAASRTIFAAFLAAARKWVP